MAFYSGGLFQLVPHYLGDPTHDVANVMWLKGTITGPLSATDLQTLANDLNTAWGNCWKGVAANTWRVDHSVVTDFSSSSGLQTTSTSGQVVGTVASASVPANTAMLVSLKVAGERYRGGHGRIYLPGLPVGQLSDPVTINGSAISTFNTAWAAWLSHLSTGTIVSGGLVPVVMHARRHRPTIIPPFVSPVTSILVSSTIATQRRRSRKVTRS